MKLRLKSCKKCITGDCEKVKEDYEETWYCLQCGYREPVKEAQNG